MQTLKAIYENGVFRPLEKPELAEGQSVQITFEQFCANNIILPLTDEIIVQAADIYADLRKKGTPIGDADILIAASAMVNRMAVITNNQSHFCHISGLTIYNWLA